MQTIRTLMSDTRGATAMSSLGSSLSGTFNKVATTVNTGA